MILQLMKQSSACTVYHENNERAMREHWRLRDDETVQELIRSERRPVTVFKPLNDAQHARSQLELDPHSKGLWIYRDYGDVVNSMVEKWGDSQRLSYTAIAAGTGDGGALDPEVLLDVQIFSEGMSAGTLSHVRRLARSDMTPEEGAALHWFSRNRLFFDLGLDQDPRVELVRYEDVVHDPDTYLKRVFEFVGCGYRSEWAGSVFKSSVKKRAAPVLREDYTDLCETLLGTLNSEYGRRVNGLAPGQDTGRPQVTVARGK